MSTGSNILFDIRNYFIDDSIEIKNDVEFLEWCRLLILKYHRVIGIILMCILLFTLYCDNVVSNGLIKKELQKGGGAGISVARGASAVVSSGAASSVASSLISGTAKEAVKKGFLSSAKDTVTAKLGEKGKEAFSLTSKLGEKAKEGGRKAITPSTYYGMGSSAARSFKEASPIFYQILYTIAFTLILAIVVLPSIGFLVVGIMCFFLLKKRIKTLKGF